MKWPNWIPQVSRPRNPELMDTWEAMTPDERRGSFVFDIVIVLITIGICVCLTLI